jgi:type I restriction enzyme R subunit
VLSPEQTFGTGGQMKFHSYTMKQAIDECFILDVLKSCTPVDSY